MLKKLTEKSKETAICIKDMEKNLRNNDLSDMDLIEQLCEANSKRVLYDNLHRKLSKSHK